MPLLIFHSWLLRLHLQMGGQLLPRLSSAVCHQGCERLWRCGGTVQRGVLEPAILDSTNQHVVERTTVLHRQRFGFRNLYDLIHLACDNAYLLVHPLYHGHAHDRAF